MIYHFNVRQSMRCFAKISVRTKPDIRLLSFALLLHSTVPQYSKSLLFSMDSVIFVSSSTLENLPGYFWWPFSVLCRSIIFFNFPSQQDTHWAATFMLGVQFKLCHCTLHMTNKLSSFVMVFYRWEISRIISSSRNRNWNLVLQLIHVHFILWLCRWYCIILLFIFFLCWNE